MPSSFFPLLLRGTIKGPFVFDHKKAPSVLCDRPKLYFPLGESERILERKEIKGKGEREREKEKRLFEIILHYFLNKPKWLRNEIVWYTKTRCLPFLQKLFYGKKKKKQKKTKNNAWNDKSIGTDRMLLNGVVLLLIRSRGYRNLIPRLVLRARVMIKNVRIFETPNV